MAIDFTALVVIALFFYRGYSRGFIVAAFSFVAILLGVLCAMKMSQSFASWLLEHGYTTLTWAPLLAYIILFAGVVIGVRMLAKLLQGAVEGLMLGTVNKAIGGVLYAIVGCVVFSSILWLSTEMKMITPEQIAASKTYGLFKGLTPKLFGYIGHILPFARDVFSKLQEFFHSGSK